MPLLVGARSRRVASTVYIGGPHLVEWDQGYAPRRRTRTLLTLPAVSRTLVMAADDDLIHLEHLLALYRGIPNAELAIVPGTSHFNTQEKPALVNAMLIDFLTNDPVPTVAPIRRAPSPPSGS